MNAIARYFFSCLLVLSFSLANKVEAQITMTASPTSYSQNFDGLGAGTSGSNITWTDNSTLAGWYEGNATTGRYYNTATPPSIGSRHWNCGATDVSTDRAFGGYSTATTMRSVGIKLLNSTGSSLSSISIVFDAESYYTVGTGSTFIIQYSTTSTNFSDVTGSANWSNVTAPISVAATGLSYTITPGTAIANGGTICVRFIANYPGSSSNLTLWAVDNFTASWAPACYTPTVGTQVSTSTQTLCLNATPTNLSFTATVPSGPAVTYQWYSNTTASTSGSSSISGATSSTYTPVTSNTGTLYYYCIATSGTCTLTSGFSGAILVKGPQGSFTGNNICSAGSGQLTFTATSGATPFTVVYSDGSNRTVSGVTSGTPFAPFTNPPPTGSNAYPLVSVTDNDGCVRTTGFTAGSATINVYTTASNSIAPGSGQSIAPSTNGTTLTVTENSVYISRQWKYATVSGGPYSTPIAGQTATTYIPNFPGPGPYYVVCESVLPCGTVTSNQVQINILTLTTGTSIAGSPFCVTAATGASIAVPFTSSGTFSGNTYSVQLSDASGSFASPVTLSGTLVSNANSGTVNATIPANKATGTGYRVRVVSNGPALTGSDNTVNLTINLAANSISPTATQNISTSVNGTTITVTDQSTATHQWYYSTISGGPYSTILTGQTGASYVPNFAGAGTYYVVCVSTFACGSITSSEARINVTVPGGRICAGGNLFTIDPGAGSTATNFVNFFDAITELNSCPLTKYVIFDVKAGVTFDETNLPAITVAGTSAAKYVLFRRSGAGANPIVRAVAGAGTADAIISIKGVSYITFDGINLKDDLNNIAEIGYYITGTALSGAQHNTIANCNITLSSTNSNITYGIYQDQSAVTPNSAGLTNSNNNYYGDTVRMATYGIYCFTNATTPAYYDNGTVIGVNNSTGAAAKCFIGDPAGNYFNIGRARSLNTTFKLWGAIGLLKQSNFTIANTEIQNCAFDNGSSVANDSIYSSGIHINAPAGTSNIYNNKIHAISSTRNDAKAKSSGITLSNGFGMITASDVVNIYNNVIYNIKSSLGTNNSSSKIMDRCIGLRTPSTNNVYYNTLDFSGVAGQTSSAGIHNESLGGDLTVRDNIFYNNTSAPTDSKYSRYCIKHEGAVIQTDFNDYYHLNPHQYHYIITNAYNPDGANSYTADPYFTGSGAEPYMPIYGFYIPADLGDLAVVNGKDILGVTRPSTLASPPHMGAYDLAATTAYVDIFGNSPVAGNFSRNQDSALVYGFGVTGSNLNTVLNSITFSATTTNSAPYIAYTAGTSDFYDFTLWSSNSPVFDATAVPIGSVINPAPAAGTNNLTFSGISGANATITAGTTKYFYLTLHVNATGVNGHNITVSTTAFSNIVFSTTTIRTGTDPVPAAGRQTIASFFYNATDPTTLDITSLTGWRIAADGSGANIPANQPSTFGGDFQVFTVKNMTPGPTMAGTNLNITGNSSKLVIGDGVTTINFAPSKPIGATIDVKTNATLDFGATDPTTSTMGILSTNSTVSYSYAGNQSILAGNYHHLTLSGTPGTHQRNLASSIGIAGTFNPGTYTAFDNNTGTVTFNGLAAQTIPQFTFNNLTINNTSGTATKFAASATNITAQGALIVTRPLLIETGKTFTISTTSSTVNINTLTGKITVNGGGVFENKNNTGTNPFTNTAGTFVYDAFATYNHNANGGWVPQGTWATNSIFLISGITSANTGGIQGHAQTFSRVIYDCPGQTKYFVLGKNLYNAGLLFIVTDSFIVKSTGNGTRPFPDNMLQLTSSDGQNNITVGNFFQYGGNVGITHNTGSAGTRSLTVNNTFYVNDSVVYARHGAGQRDSSRFYLINQPDDPSVTGLLTVRGNMIMTHSTIMRVQYSEIADPTNLANVVLSSAPNKQYLTFDKMVGDINFDMTNSKGVNLLSNMTAHKFKLSGGTTFSLGNNNTLTINGAITYGSGTNKFAGSKTARLTLGTPGHGASNLAGGTIQFVTSPVNTDSNFLRRLTINDSAYLILATKLNIAAGDSTSGQGIGTVTLGDHKNANLTALTLNDSLILKSDAFGTARIAAIPEDPSNPNVAGNSTAKISGKITVERYFPAKRTWRLVSAPVQSTTANTIKQDWQELASATAPSVGLNNVGVVNPDPHPPYGIHITGPNNTPTPVYTAAISAAGFDQSPQNRSSINYYDVASNTWKGVTNTQTNKVTAYSGYLLFVRGPRSYNISTTTNLTTPVSAVLRTTGDMNTGHVKIPVSQAGFAVIGNPYASAIRFSPTMISNNSTLMGGSNSYAIYDPLKGALSLSTPLNIGGWVQVVCNAGVYSSTYDPSTDVSGGVHPINLKGRIESGAAFVVTAAQAGNFAIHESDKCDSSNNYLFRPMDIQYPTLRANMYKVENGTPVYWADGALDLFDDNFSNTVDWAEDVRKFNSTAENISIRRDGQLIAIEQRQPVNAAVDTIFYNIDQMKLGDYRIDFITENWAIDPSLVGFVEDSYTGTRTPFNANGITTVPFKITATAGSYYNGRFRIVFGPEGGPLPVTYSSVKAYQQNRDIAVEWKVENELNIKEYEVESSTDGRRFTKVNTTTAKGNNNSSVSYNWLDVNAAAGVHYYRIRSIDQNSTGKYSQTVKVTIGKGTPGIAIYPNPVKGGVIGLQMTNMPAGTYQLRLINAIGQLTQTATVNHAEGSAGETIQLKNTLSKGVYTLDIVYPDNTNTSLKLLVD